MLPVTDSLPVRLHPLAEDDASAAYSWYLERNPIVAEIFFAELNSAIGRKVRNSNLHVPARYSTGRIARSTAMMDARRASVHSSRCAGGADCGFTLDGKK